VVVVCVYLKLQPTARPEKPLFLQLGFSPAP